MLAKIGSENISSVQECQVQINRYDGEGLRHELEENGVLVKFLFNEDREVIAEENSERMISRYIRGLGIICSDNEEAKTYYHYVSDEQGSVTHILSDEAVILNRYAYDAFGNIISKYESVQNRFCYNGEMLDHVTQQYYLRARFYNPVIGRFTQEDTYYGDGMNLYNYCKSNPIGYIDPSGHYTCPIQQSLYEKYIKQGMPEQAAREKCEREYSKNGYYTDENGVVRRENGNQASKEEINAYKKSHNGNLPEKKGSKRGTSSSKGSTDSRLYNPNEPMSPSNYPPTDPDYNVPPVRYEPKSIEEVERMRNGRGPTTKASAGDRNIEAHHRKQKSTANGGIIDDLEEYTHRRGGNHKRHTEPSELTPKQRAKEIREYWKKRGAEYILPREGI